MFFYTDDLAAMRKKFEEAMTEAGGTVVAVDDDFEADSCMAITTKWVLDLSKGLDAVTLLSDAAGKAYAQEMHRQHLELRAQSNTPGHAQIDLVQGELTKNGLTAVPRQNFDGLSWSSRVSSSITANQSFQLIFLQSDAFAHCVAVDTRGPTYRFFDLNAGEARFTTAAALSRAFNNWAWKMGFMQANKGGAVVTRATS